MEKICGIYMIKNTVNGKVYIGQSVNIARRWAKHKRELKKNNYHEKQHLQDSWNKYGESNFEFKIIEECQPNATILNERETYWIGFYDSSNKEKGYNKALSGGTTLGIKFSDEIREKMSKSRLGMAFSEEHRKKIGEANRKRVISEQMRRKIAEANRRRVYTASMRENARSAKLNFKQVSEIREKYDNNEYTYEKLAESYQVSVHTIKKIVHFHTWKIQENTTGGQ